MSNPPSSRLPLSERRAYHCLEDVVGCKWSAGVIATLARGVQRPGQLERCVPGISKKILNERLRKLLSYGLILRTEVNGRVPEVHYQLTSAGHKLAHILSQIRTLQNEIHTALDQGEQQATDNVSTGT